MEKEKMIKNIFVICIIALVLSSMSAFAYKPLHTAESGVMNPALPVYTLSEPLPQNPPVIIEPITPPTISVPIMPPVRTCLAYPLAEGCSPAGYDENLCPLPPVCTAKDIVLRVKEYTAVGDIRIGLLSIQGTELLKTQSMPPRLRNTATISLSPDYMIQSLEKPTIATLAIGQKANYRGYTIKLVKIDAKMAYFTVILPSKPTFDSFKLGIGDKHSFGEYTVRLTRLDGTQTLSYPTRELRTAAIEAYSGRTVQKLVLSEGQSRQFKPYRLTLVAVDIESQTAKFKISS